MNATDSLKNLREAHRLIYAFQQCVLGFVFKVRQDVMHNGDGTIDGLKHFSASLPSRKRGKMYNQQAFSTVRERGWAWDFLPTYAYEYHLGEFQLTPTVTFETPTYAKISVIQIVDDAIYASDNGIVEDADGELSKTTQEEILDLSFHPSCEKTCSVFVFVCETGSSNGQFSEKWNTSDAELSRFIKSKKKTSVQRTSDGYFAQYLINMEEIFSPEGTDKVINRLQDLITTMWNLKGESNGTSLIEHQFEG